MCKKNCQSVILINKENSDNETGIGNFYIETDEQKKEVFCSECVKNKIISKLKERALDFVKKKNYEVSFYLRPVQLMLDPILSFSNLDFLSLFGETFISIIRNITSKVKVKMPIKIESCKNCKAANEKLYKFNCGCIYCFKCLYN